MPTTGPLEGAEEIVGTGAMEGPTPDTGAGEMLGAELGDELTLGPGVTVGSAPFVGSGVVVGPCCKGQEGRKMSGFCAEMQGILDIALTEIEGTVDGETEDVMVGAKLGRCDAPVGRGVTVGNSLGGTDGRWLGRRVGAGVPICNTGVSDGWGLMEGASEGTNDGTLEGFRVRVGATDIPFDGLLLG